MQKKLAIVLMIPTFIYAAYNPFFREDPAPARVQSPSPKVVYKDKTPQTPRKNITIKFFGFVSTYKGEYALIKFNGKTIVIGENDSLYNNAETYKIAKITSNYIVINDNIGRAQKIYFSSGA